MPFQRHFALLMVSLFLASCLEQDVSLFVNPDGSGKVIVSLPIDDGAELKLIETRQGSVDLLVKDGVLPAEGAVGLARASAFIEGTSGVEEWTNYKSMTNAAGRQVVVLRGYFRDLNQLKLSGFRPGKLLQNDAEPPTVRLTTADDGTQTFSAEHLMANDQGMMAFLKPDPSTAAKNAGLSQAQIAQQMQSKRQAMKMTLGMMETALKGMNVRLLLRF